MVDYEAVVKGSFSLKKNKQKTSSRALVLVRDV